jgi:branched-chain amino acid transport system substrate-binding protein
MTTASHSSSKLRTSLALGLVLTSLCLGTSHAQEMGVTRNQIKIGTWGPLSGPVAQWGNLMLGMEAYFRYVNDQGGIHGRTLTLIKRDDQYQATRTKAVVKELIERQGVFALLGGTGTPNGMAILPDVIANRIPWVAPATGSAQFGEPMKREVFTVYTNYIMESAMLVRHAANTLNISKVGVFYLNNAFGQEGLRGVQEEAKRLGGKVNVVANIPHESSETSMAAQALRLKESGAEAVVMYSADSFAINLVREFAKINYKPQILASSTLLGTTLFQAEQWPGAIIASYMPVLGIDPKANEYLKRFGKYASPASVLQHDPVRFLQGLAYAEPLVEGLRRAGPNLDREKFIAAMESLKDWRGSFFHKLSYSATDHQGNTSIMLVRAVNTPEPSFEKVTGWVEF